jgi:hypothetical protein
MKLYENIIDAVKDAQAGFVGADWTHPRVPVCDAPEHGTHTPCPACRPDYDQNGEVLCEGNDLDRCQTCIDAEAAAVTCDGLGDECIAALRRGDLETALAKAREAETIEDRFGDAPTWRPVVEAIEAHVERETEAQTRIEIKIRAPRHLAQRLGQMAAVRGQTRNALIVGLLYERVIELEKMIG